MHALGWCKQPHVQAGTHACKPRPHQARLVLRSCHVGECSPSNSGRPAHVPMHPTRSGTAAAITAATTTTPPPTPLGTNTLTHPTTVVRPRPPARLPARTHGQVRPAAALAVALRPHVPLPAARRALCAPHGRRGAAQGGRRLIAASHIISLDVGRQAGACISMHVMLCVPHGRRGATQGAPPEGHPPSRSVVTCHMMLGQAGTCIGMPVMGSSSGNPAMREALCLCTCPTASCLHDAEGFSQQWPFMTSHEMAEANRSSNGSSL